MNPVQAKRPPSVAARSRRAAGNTFIGIGVLVLILTVDPIPLFGESPAGESIAVMQTPIGVAETRQGAFLQPASNDRVSLTIMPHTSGPLEARSARIPLKYLLRATGDPCRSSKIN